MRAFRLVANIMAFNGTDHDAERNERVIAYSKDKAKLERIREEIWPDDYFRREETPYMAAAKKYFSSWPRNGEATFEVCGHTVPLYPIDDYYGDGEIYSLTIEEFDYIPPEEFI